MQNFIKLSAALMSDCDNKEN